MNPKAYYWLDIETTGLNPKENTILEIGLARAPFDNPHEITIIANEVLFFRDWSYVTPYVINMHATSGLMRDCMHAEMRLPDEEPYETKNIERVLLERLDAFAADWIPKAAKDGTEKMTSDELPVLAGSSVHFDRSFLREHLPKFSHKFSHRFLDVSALKLYCRSMGMSIQQKKEAHRAIEDIKESVRHSQECFEWLSLHASEIEQFAKGTPSRVLPF